ncbi:M16 family metallopeptidase [uncultured Ruthenibacterium sp.]|uniref:M16 family metallopeptidase n=1 Tax=uncultured Ruthenibacterium sp. TaxID=1905347 RepID=UPI00349EB5EB
MERKQISDGVYLTVLPAEQFHRCRISINFIWPATREWATAEALMPLLMERCCADCPDMTLLSKKLARLYGASLSVDGVVNSGSRVLTVAVGGIKDEFALNGEQLSSEYATLALATAFRPYFVNGVFDPEAVEIEKEQLRELIAGEVNEKRGYCIRQARRKFFGDSAAGVERYGYAQEVNGLSSEQVTKAFFRMLCTARIEVMVLGADAAAVEQSVKQALVGLERKPDALPQAFARPAQSEQSFEEPMDTAQGKLCLLFTSGQPQSPEQLSAARVAVALLGGTATSRLFVNVREKRSLCYYCAASYASMMGMLCIDSGVEHQNASAAKKAILEELDALKNGPITEKELNDTKRSLKNQLAAVTDTLQGMENWYFGEILRASLLSPQQVMEQVDAVTKEDVQNVLRTFTLSVSYTLTKGENAHV